MRHIVQTIAIVIYWFSGGAIAANATADAIFVGIMAMIVGLVLWKRVKDVEEILRLESDKQNQATPEKPPSSESKKAPSSQEPELERLLYALFVPPPILAIFGLILTFIAR